MLALALLLTHLWFPSRYWDVVGVGSEVVVRARANLVLVALFARARLELSRRGREARGSP